MPCQRHASALRLYSVFFHYIPNPRINRKIFTRSVSVQDWQKKRILVHQAHVCTLNSKSLVNVQVKVVKQDHKLNIWAVRGFIQPSDGDLILHMSPTLHVVNP